MSDFQNVAVLGAGVMGSGIAAHLAGSGLRVLLIDIVPPDKTMPKNAFAMNGLDKALKAKPAAFFTTRDADRVQIGNFDDDLARAAQSDLVIEVVKEDLAIKQNLFAKLEPLLGKHTIVASNTSGLPIQEMMQGRSMEMQKRFLVTHFFNPVRYMKLLEVVAGQNTDPEVVKKVARFGSEVLGKGIVYGKDTTNFVANRIGVLAMMNLIRNAIEGGYTIEEVDAIFGPAMGRPKSAVFRTADMVGLDTVADVAQNCYRTLQNDEQRREFQLPQVLQKMIEKKLIGEKAGAGFYRKTKAGIESLDLKTLEYRPQAKAKFNSVGATKNAATPEERVRILLAGDDRGAELARKSTFATLAYASFRLGEIADDIVNIDRAMRWGFAWALGPFEIWDAIGVAEAVGQMEAAGVTPAPWVKEMLAGGRTRFYEDNSYWDPNKKAAVPIPVSSRQWLLKDRRKTGGVVFENDGATLYDIGDRIACLEFHSKMNAIDSDIIAMVARAADEVEKNFDGLVIGNQADEAFSAGANIFLVVMAAQQGNFSAIDEMVKSLQNGLQRLKYLSVPVVTAPFGLTLGGGAEVAMAGTATRAHAELYMGLVEAGVGLIPSGGGCKELLARLLGNLPDDADPFPTVKKIFTQIALGKVSMSAEEARQAGFLTEFDQVTLNRDFLLEDAKQTALGLFRAGYRPLRQRTFKLPGEGGYATFLSGLQMMHVGHQISEHDVLVGSKLAWVLCGGRVSTAARVTEQHILDLEREAFLSLCGEKKTQERMQFMLMNGKPLRN